MDSLTRDTAMAPLSGDTTMAPLSGDTTSSTLTYDTSMLSLTHDTSMLSLTHDTSMLSLTHDMSMLSLTRNTNMPPILRMPNEILGAICAQLCYHCKNTMAGKNRALLLKQTENFVEPGPGHSAEDLVALSQTNKRLGGVAQHYLHHFICLDQPKDEDENDSMLVAAMTLIKRPDLAESVRWIWISHHGMRLGKDNSDLSYISRAASNIYNIRRYIDHTVSDFLVAVLLLRARLANSVVLTGQRINVDTILQSIDPAGGSGCLRALKMLAYIPNKEGRQMNYVRYGCSNLPLAIVKIAPNLESILTGPQTWGEFRVERASLPLKALYLHRQFVGDLIPLSREAVNMQLLRIMTMIAPTIGLRVFVLEVEMPDPFKSLKTDYYNGLEVSLNVLAVRRVLTDLRCESSNTLRKLCLNMPIAFNDFADSSSAPPAVLSTDIFKLSDFQSLESVYLHLDSELYDYMFPRIVTEGQQNPRKDSARDVSSRLPPSLKELHIENHVSEVYELIKSLADAKLAGSFPNLVEVVVPGLHQDKHMGDVRALLVLMGVRLPQDLVDPVHDWDYN
ncbi:hypothetical protein B0T24DRAFT_699962 [Lasiosphaeria ovina]|uniref:Uncharacterized protein n=1 Tax=Lasiosphaeria ovina TaxID=92902 RepID=A0AAE0NA47_9PEZI|nr:hypothetical protein B0T24DRAFT_699962 [Lasiosphaeria ovina]